MGWPQKEGGTFLPPKEDEKKREPEIVHTCFLKLSGMEAGSRSQLSKQLCHGERRQAGSARACG